MVEVPLPPPHSARAFYMHMLPNFEICNKNTQGKCRVRQRHTYIDQNGVQMMVDLSFSEVLRIKPRILCKLHECVIPLPYELQS
jgi:hypothetical protein